MIYFPCNKKYATKTHTKSLYICITTSLLLKLGQNFVFQTYSNTDFPVSSGLRTVNGLGSIPTFLGIKSLAKKKGKLLMSGSFKTVWESHF